MPNERVIDLIHRDLDRETTAAESSELREILVSDVPAREEYESVREVVQQLDSVAPLEPPAGFKASVMEKIRTAAQSRPNIRVASSHAAVPPAIRRQNFARAAYGAAAGIIVGVFLSALFFADQGSLRPIDASGAMSAADAWKLVAKRKVSRDGVDASIEVKRNGERVALLTRLNASQKRQVDIRWQPVDAPLEAVARVGGGSLRAYDGGIAIDADGRTVVTAIVSEKRASIHRVVITGKGAPLLELEF